MPVAHAPRMPKMVLSIPRSALGDLTTTIFIALPVVPNSFEPVSAPAARPSTRTEGDQTGRMEQQGCTPHAQRCRSQALSGL